MTTRKNLAIFVLSGFLMAPMPAFASAEITEIMYDLPGSDSGREWVEVTNSGSDTLDLTGYKLFEANTNHALTILAGSGSLAPGASAILVEDQSKFSADNPAYSGPLYKASFDLSNTGEALALKDSSGTVVDSVTYDSGQGAAGDGNTLHRSGTTFVPGAPDPGVYAAGSVQSPAPSDSTASSTTQSQTQTQTTQIQTGGGSVPTLATKITAPQTVMVGGGTFFSAAAYYPDGSLAEGVRYQWNFGDGVTAEGQTLMHGYTYPGKYAVYLTVAAGISAGTGRVVVTAIPAQLGLLVEPDGSLVLENKSSQELDFGLWSLSNGTATFVIPEHTIVFPNDTVRFASATLTFFAEPGAILRYPNGALAATAAGGEAAVPAPAATSNPVAKALPPVTHSAERAAPALEPIPAKAAVPSTSAADLEAAAAGSGSAVPVWISIAGLGALVLFGAAAVWYARAEAPAGAEETSSGAEEFDIDTV